MAGQQSYINVLRKNNNGKNRKRYFCLLCPRITHDSYSEKYLGVPFNISSYALLIHMVAHSCGLTVGDFIYTLGDYHIYRNHLTQVEELLAREPMPLPRLEIKDEPGRLRGLDGLLMMRYENLELSGYKSHGKIAAVVAV